MHTDGHFSKTLRTRDPFVERECCEMTTIPPTDRHLKTILERTRTIAAVGVSANTIRPSHYVVRYLKHKGYRIVPVNPRYAGEELLGERIHASLASVADAGIEPDMVDVFRRSEEAGGVVDEAIAALGGRGLRTVWMQIGVVDEAAAERARAAGLDVVMNLCPKMEHQRLFGELRMGGFNTRVISSRRG